MSHGFWSLAHLNLELYIANFETYIEALKEDLRTMTRHDKVTHWCLLKLHPPKQTWNLKMGAPFFKGDSYWFHHHFQVPAVNFWGCNCFDQLFSKASTRTPWKGRWGSVFPKPGFALATGWEGQQGLPNRTENVWLKWKKKHVVFHFSKAPKFFCLPKIGLGQEGHIEKWS